MSRNQDNAMQPPVPPEMSCMDWVNENKMMIILVVLILAGAVWYFWFREDSDGMPSPKTPELTSPGGKSFNVTRMRR